MRTPLQKGDFVFASSSPKLDPRYRGAIGYLHHIYESASGTQLGFVVGEQDGRNIDTTYFPHARRVSNSSAERIRRIYRRQRSPRFDQIWQFLIAEHRKMKNKKATT